MLGDVRLAESRRVHQLGNGLLSISQGIEEGQAGGLGERLESLADQPQKLRRQFV